MAEGGYEEIPMEERGHDNDGFDEDEEKETSFGGGGNVVEGSIAREIERGARPKTETKTKVSYENPTYEAGGEGEIGLDDSIFEHRDKLQDAARRRIREKYPNWDPKTNVFVATVDGKNRVTVSLIKGRKIDSKPYVLFKEDGTLRKGLPKKIVDDLGKRVSEVLEEVDERESSIDELRIENEGLRKRTDEGLSLIRESIEEITKLRENIEENKAKTSNLEYEIGRINEEKERLKEEKDEDLKQAKEDYEVEVERLKNDYEVRVKELERSYNDEISDSNRNYEERIRGIVTSMEWRWRKLRKTTKRK